MCGTTKYYSSLLYKFDFSHTYHKSCERNYNPNSMSGHPKILFKIITSGNRTLGSRFYSDLLDISVCKR